MRNRLGLHFVARREVQTPPAAKFASMGCSVQRGPKITPVQQPLHNLEQKICHNRLLRYYHHFRHLPAKGIVQHFDHAARLSDSSPVVHQETIYKAIAYHVLNRLLIRQPDAPDVLMSRYCIQSSIMLAGYASIERYTWQAESGVSPGVEQSTVKIFDKALYVFSGFMTMVEDSGF